mgnify:CR=1 FL=1
MQHGTSAQDMAPAVDCRAVRKVFNTTTVLDDVTMTVGRGKVVALVGENGAGKSTLLKIVAGLHPPSGGELSILGEAVTTFKPTEAQARGVQIVTQELSLVPELAVWENIFLGRLRCRGPGLLGLIDSRRMIREAQEALDAFGVAISARARLSSISLSYAQIVEIVKAVHCKPQVLLLDEPTSSLTDSETERLFAIVEKLKAAGITVIFTTHKMNEIQRMSEEIVVLRDGRITLTARTGEITPDQVVEAMVGRELSHQKIAIPTVDPAAPPRLSVRGYSTRAGSDADIALELRPGEILGLAGIAGAGRTSFLESLFGIRPPVRGEVLIDGAAYEKRGPSRSIKLGMAFVPEDRKSAGLVLSMSVGQNASLAKLEQFTGPMGLVRGREEGLAAETALLALHTKFQSRRMEVQLLSGGNQQKVLVSRWLISDRPRLVLLDEPTRGIDVGAKADMYDLIADFASEGAAVIVSSSELPELMLLCHRIAVFQEGTLKNVFVRGSFSEAAIVKAAIGE